MLMLELLFSALAKGCMIGTTKTLVLRAVFYAVVVLSMAASPVYAQSFLSSMESVIGPIAPNCGIASTFKSEVGTGLSLMSLDKLQLSGGNLPAGFSSIALQHLANLDESPVRFDAYVKFRLWRFGARAQWTQFEERSRRPDLGHFSFTNLKLGGDFDVIQHCWLVVGASGDYYLSNPEFRGTVLHPIGFTPTLNVDLTGKKPVTIGAYARYIPPEILNIPVHAEFYANFPVYGSSLTQYGGALAFRPQIYRFDAAIKIVLEKTFLKVLDASDSPNPYTLNTEWLRYGLDLAIYF
jgi:hypothetical protein